MPAGPVPVRAKPRLRGVSHQVAFFVAPAFLVPTVVAADDGAARAAVGVYAAGVLGLFGASALFHRRTWAPVPRLWMRRLDHSMIFVMIAGTYTAMAVRLPPGTATALLTVVWGATVAGIAVRLVRRRPAPKWASAVPFVALGWVAVAVAPQLSRSIGAAGLALVVAGGLLYSAGAAVYARRRPDPVPGVFGYHEVFHAFTIAAALVHWACIAFVVL